MAVRTDEAIEHLDFVHEPACELELCGEGRCYPAEWHLSCQCGRRNYCCEECRLDIWEYSLTCVLCDQGDPKCVRLRR